jgi:uncharacterized OB-fold protein
MTSQQPRRPHSDRLQPLSVTVCPSCQAAYAYRRAICTRCGAATEQQELLLTGHVYSNTTVYRPPVGFESFVPYTVALIMCDLGLQVLAMTSGAQMGDDVVVGLADLGQASIPFALSRRPGESLPQTSKEAPRPAVAGGGPVDQRRSDAKSVRCIP